MKTCIASLESVSPYNQSRAHTEPKLERETGDAYEERTWREKAHYMPDTGEIFIPPMSLKMAVDDAAKMLGMQIPGKGKATYTKFFKSGVLVLEGPRLGLTVEDAECCRIHANSDGVRGSGKRVWRSFPRIPAWQAEVTFHILADEITQDVFEKTLIQAGAFVGIGQFRPQNGGYYGRFEVKKFSWS